MDTLETLRNCPLFANLEDASLSHLQRQARSRRFAGGEILFLELAEGDEVFLILDGEVELEFQLANADADVQPLTLGRGEILGEVSFVDGGPRSATATARTEVTVLAWSASELHRFCESNPEQGYRLAMGIARLLAQRLRRWNVHMLNRVSWGLD